MADFPSVADSIRSKILATVEEAYSLSARMVRMPEMLMQPDRTRSPGVTSAGTDSPVILAVSTEELPSTTTPSTGIRWPGRTRKRSPASTSSGSHSSGSPSRKTRATSGRRSIRAATERRERSTAMLWNSSPTWKNSITAAPSSKSIRAKAPTVANVIRKFSSKIWPCPIFLTALMAISRPHSNQDISSSPTAVQ